MRWLGELERGRKRGRERRARDEGRPQKAGPRGKEPGSTRQELAETPTPAIPSPGPHPPGSPPPAAAEPPAHTPPEAAEPRGRQVSSAAPGPSAPQVPQPRTNPLRRCPLLPGRPAAAPAAVRGPPPHFGEADKLHKSGQPLPNGDALCEHTLPAPRRARPRRACSRRAQAPPPAGPRPGRRRNVAPAPLPHPTPRGNSKHGARDGGGVGGEETDRAGAWGASRPSRPWLGGRTPGRRPGLRLRAGPAMLQRGRRSGHVPGRDTRRSGSARRGSPRGSGRGGRQAPAVQADERRRSHASAGPPRARPRPALRTSRPQAPLGSPSSAGRKVTWPGPGARARRGVGTGLGRASSGRCAEARAWGGSRRLGPLAALPAPFCRSHGGSAGCGGAHAQGRRSAAGEGAPRDFRTVAPRLPSPSWRRVALGDDASRPLPIALAFGFPLRFLPGSLSLPGTPGRVGGGFSDLQVSYLLA